MVKWTVLYIAFILSLYVLVWFCSCSNTALEVVVPDMSSSSQDMTKVEQDEEGVTGPGQGNLPPGYWKRGCGWDAPCGNPWGFKDFEDFQQDRQ